MFRNRGAGERASEARGKALARTVLLVYVWGHGRGEGAVAESGAICGLATPSQGPSTKADPFFAKIARGGV